MIAVLDRFDGVNPHPRCELYYRTPYQLLVSVVLSAQATDKSVNKAMQPLYDSGFGPDTVLALGQEGFLEKIRTIGLAPTKSKNILRLTRILRETYGDTVPQNRDALESLPGVGRKTANVVLGELWGEPTLAVDTHVLRVSARLGFHRENAAAKADKVEKALLKIVPRAFLPRAHHWLVLHGRYQCTARNPKCASCLIEDLCPKIGVSGPIG